MQRNTEGAATIHHFFQVCRWVRTTGNSANTDLIGQASDENHTLETNKQINKLETPTCQDTFAACIAIQKEQQPFIISSGANFWTDGQQLFSAIELRISGILLFLSCKISCKQVSLKPQHVRTLLLHAARYRGSSNHSSFLPELIHSIEIQQLYAIQTQQTGAAGFRK